MAYLGSYDISKFGRTQRSYGDRSISRAEDAAEEARKQQDDDDEQRLIDAEIEDETNKYEAQCAYDLAKAEAQYAYDQARIDARAIQDGVRSYILGRDVTVTARSASPSMAGRLISAVGSIVQSRHVAHSATAQHHFAQTAAKANAGLAHTRSGDPHHDPLNPRKKPSK